MDLDLDLFLRAALRPERYTLLTLDGDDDGGDLDLPRWVRAEAAHILSLAGPDTDPDEAAWAAGALTVRDAVTLTGPFAALALAGLERTGGSLDGGRMYRTDRRGLRVTSGAQTLVTVGWDAVAAVMTATALPDDLVEQVDVLAADQNRVRTAIAAATEADAEELWAEMDDLDHLSRYLAARAWDLTRPEDPMDALVRLLLDDAGASSSAGTPTALPLAE